MEEEFEELPESIIQTILIMARRQRKTGQESPGFIKGAMEWLAWSGNVTMRSKFGYRYFTGKRFVPLFILLWLADMLSPMWAVLMNLPHFSTFLQFHLLFVLVCAAWHYFKMERRLRKNVRWYSYTTGESYWYRRLRWFPLLNKLNYVQFRTYVEPGFFLLTGLFWKRIDAQYGWFLILTGFSMYMAEREANRAFRDRLQDLEDGEIESQAITDILDGKRKEEHNSGYVIAVSDRETLQKYDEFETAQPVDQ